MCLSGQIYLPRTADLLVLGQILQFLGLALRHAKSTSQ